MVNTLRRFSQPIMLFIAVGVIVSFAFFGPGGCDDRRGAGGRNALFEIYGKKISLEEQERLKNKLEVYGALGNGYAEALAFEDFESASLNMLVFEHEADAMGISATDEEVLAEVEKTPGFQREQKFDGAAFELILQQVMQPRGFSKEHVDTFLRGAIRVRKVQEILKGTAFVTAGEVKDSLVDRNQVTEASFVAFKKADFFAAAAVTDDELKQRYEQQKEQLKTDELRKVRYVAFLMPPQTDTAKSQTEAERTKVLQISVNAAYDFAQAVKKGAKFDELAAREKEKFEKGDKTKAEYGFIDGVTESFDKETPPTLLEGLDELANAAFDLKKDTHVSQHIIGKKGAYVIMLPEDGITAPKQQTFEETKELLMTQLKDEKAVAAVRVKGEEIQKKIVEAKKAGKSFTEACEAAGVKAEAYPAYSQTKRPQGPNVAFIPSAAAKLAPGEVSEFVVSTDGGLVVHLDQRPVVDEKGLEAEKAATQAGLESSRGRSIFREWLRERRNAAGIGSTKAEDKKS